MSVSIVEFRILTTVVANSYPNAYTVDKDGAQ